MSSSKKSLIHYVIKKYGFTLAGLSSNTIDVAILELLNKNKINNNK